MKEANVRESPEEWMDGKGIKVWTTADRNENALRPV
jgi:hypothetical protein